MASNHTSNYNLNQWEPEDKVIRTDFNEDNQKVDTALKGLADTFDIKTSQLSTTLTARVAELNDARRTDLLLDETLSSDRSSVSLSLAEINLDEYFRLDLVVHSTPCQATTHLYMRFNGMSNARYCALGLSGASTTYTDYISLLPNSHKGGTMFCSIWEEGLDKKSIIWMLHGTSPDVLGSFIVNGGRFDQLNYRNLTSLYIYPSAPNVTSGLVVKAGTRFRLYGLR